MSTANPYRAAGTFSGVSYVEREADAQLRLAIERNKRYPYLLAPRQSGKSSLILHTIQRLDQRVYFCAFVDLSIFSRQDLVDYDFFLEKFITICVSNIQKPENCLIGSWFMETLEVLLKRHKERIVIFVDDIDVLSACEFKDSFFSLLRSVYNQRALNHELTRIQFVLSGATQQTQLISDPFRSPFNVALAIQLSDFTVEQIHRILAPLREARVQMAPHLVDTIYHYTSGSVYLTQLILEKLWECYVPNPRQEILSTTVESVVETIIATAREDIHFAHIYRTITESPVVQRAFTRLYKGQSVDESVRETLQLIGIIGENCPFRNVIYERVFGVGGSMEVVLKKKPPLLSAGYQQILHRAQQEAARQGFSFVGSPHLFLALCAEDDVSVRQILSSTHIDPDDLRRAILFVLGEGTYSNKERPTYTLVLQNVLQAAEVLAKDTEADSIDAMHLWLALLRRKDIFIRQILERYGIHYTSLVEAISRAER